MSDVCIQIKGSVLQSSISKFDDEQEYYKNVRAFIRELKVSFANEIVRTRGIKYEIAYELLVTKNYNNTLYTIGIEPPNNYSIKYRPYARLLLEKDKGSVDKGILPDNKLSYYCSVVSKYCHVLWADYIKGR